MKLSEHFTLEEMVRSTTAQLYNIDNMPSKSTIEELRQLCTTILEPIRQRYGKPIRVTSGYRCDKLNRLVGGSRTSQHCFGTACDCKAMDGNNKKLWDVIVSMIESGEIEVRQLIDEKGLSWIHISNNDRWHTFQKNKIFKQR